MIDLFISGDGGNRLLLTNDTERDKELVVHCLCIIEEGSDNHPNVGGAFLVKCQTVGGGLRTAPAHHILLVRERAVRVRLFWELICNFTFQVVIVNVLFY